MARAVPLLKRTYWLGRQIAARLEPSRRYNCHLQTDTDWHGRALEATQLLARHLEEVPDASRPLEVADLGCGNQRIRELLRAATTREIGYHGYDLHPQSEDVSQLDVRQAMPDRTFDAVFILGLLEYVCDVGAVVRRLRPVSRQVVASYCIIDGADLTAREREWRGWNTHLTRAQVEDAFTRAGFRMRDSLALDEGRTALWLWEVAADPEPGTTTLPAQAVGDVLRSSGPALPSPVPPA